MLKVILKTLSLIETVSETSFSTRILYAIIGRTSKSGAPLAGFS